MSDVRKAGSGVQWKRWGDGAPRKGLHRAWFPLYNTHVAMVYDEENEWVAAAYCNLKKDVPSRRVGFAEAMRCLNSSVDGVVRTRVRRSERAAHSPEHLLVILIASDRLVASHSLTREILRCRDSLIRDNDKNLMQIVASALAREGRRRRRTRMATLAKPGKVESVSPSASADVVVT